MAAPFQSDARLLLRVAAYLCRADARPHAAAIPHLFDPRYRAIRWAVGRRDLLRTLRAARPAPG